MAVGDVIKKLPRVSAMAAFAVLLSATLSTAQRIERFIPDEAIVSVGANRSLSAEVASNTSPSFRSLDKQRLSKFVAKVKNKRSATRDKGARIYWSSRNPCNAPTIARMLRANPRLVCEPNMEIRTAIAPPNDTYLSYLFALNSSSVGRIQAPAAWDLTTGSASVVVGVIDTGIDYNHPDLASNIWVNPGEISGNGIDDDGNGYIDDLRGIDAVNNDSDPMDDQYHGTHVAGTIGAVGNNGVGVVGVAWNVKMIGCKFLNASGSGSTSGAITCIDYMTDLKTNRGVNLIATNNSWGGGGYSSALVDAITRAHTAGIVFVAAAGNDGLNNDSVASYPSNYPIDNVIAVAAIDQSGALASFSNYGATMVDIGAPGVSILSTYPGNQYAFLNGTSMAAPQVTGALALLRAYRPTLSMSASINAILQSGSALSSLNGKTVTGDNLNVYGALIAPTVTPGASPTATATATITPTPTRTPTPTVTATPTATNEPGITPAPSPTAAPSPSPSLAPTSVPTQAPTPIAQPTSPPSLNVGNARVVVSARRSGGVARFRCALSARAAQRRAMRASAEPELAGYAISLQDSSGRRKGQRSSDELGVASFAVSGQSSRLPHRCLARLPSGVIASQFVRVR